MRRAVFLAGALLTLVSQVLVPESTAAQGPVFPGDKSSFVQDVTFPDDNGKPLVTVQPGQKLRKVWRFANVGTVDWKDRQLRAVQSTAGEADVKAINRKPGLVSNTPHGQQCDITVDLVAPKTTGLYRVDFKMTDKTGRVLLPNQLPAYIAVNVQKRPLF